MEAPGIPAHQQAVDQFLDDLAEGQRHDGQIVAPQTQHRGTDDHAGHGSHSGAHDHGDCQSQGIGGNGALQAHGSDDAGEGAHAHETGVAQAQFAQDAHGQVQGDGHGHVAADGDQLSGEGPGEAAGIPQDHRSDEGDDDAQVGDEVGAGRTLHRSDFHCAHLTLSPGHTGPAGRRV